MYRLRNHSLLAYFLLSMLALACNGGEESEVASTYHADIRPIIDDYCVRCHSDDSVAPFSFDDWAEVQALGPAMVAAVEERSMPPWAMNPSCQETKDSLWLPDELIERFTAWRDQGFPEGDPADYQAPIEQSWDYNLGEPDLTLQPRESYTPDLSKVDDYRCLQLTEPLANDLFITANSIQPENEQVTHHILIYAVPPSDQAALEALERADEQPGYACFGDSGLQGAQTIGGWAPGGTDDVYGEGIAMKVAAGSSLVLQMHYNSATTNVAEPERPTILLWTLAEGEYPDYLIHSYPVAKQTLDIKANDANSIQHSTQRIGTKGTLVATSPHMHLLGKQMNTSLVRSDDTEICLTQVDQWDFNWQLKYLYADEKPIEIGIDDRINLTCTYDNSASNQPLIDGARSEPRDVRWGDGSFDEMCLNYLSVVSPYYGDENSEGICGGYENCISACVDDPFCNITCMGSMGINCLSCGLGGLFQECTIGSCFGEGVTFLGCMQGCVDSEEQAVDCLYDACGEHFQPYWSCAQELWKNGQCQDDLAGCPTLKEF